MFDVIITVRIRLESVNAERAETTARRLIDGYMQDALDCPSVALSGVECVHAIAVLEDAQ